MILKRIKIQNIRSYKNADITFPKGSTILSGDIGSGKTSILLAIEFALFGLQPNQRGSSLLRNDEKQAKVELFLEIDEKEIIIERSLIKKSKSIVQDYSSISINNEKYGGSVTEIKNRILSLLNYPKEFSKKTNLLYKFTVYTPQEEMKQIILESKDTRLNTLRHVFGIDKYKRIEENAEIITSKSRAKIREGMMVIQSLDFKKISLIEKQNALKEHQEKLNSVISDLEKIKQEKLSKQIEIDEINKKLEEKKNLETEKTKSEVRLSGKKSELENIKKSMLNFKSQVEEAKKLVFNEEEFNSAKNMLDRYENNLKNFNERFVLILTKINTQELRKKEAEEIKSRISGMQTCPTCMQNVNEEYKNNIFSKIYQEIKIMNLDIQNLPQKKQNLNMNIEEAKREIEIHKQKISEQQILKVKLESIQEKTKSLEDLEKQDQLIEGEINMISKKINLITNSISEFQIFDEKYKIRDKELQDIKSKENQTLIKQAETKKEIQFTEIQIKDLEKEISDLESIKAKLEFLKELEFWLTNKFLPFMLFIEKNVMMKLKEEFSKLFAEWFSILVSETLSVKLDENFSPIIQQQDYELDYTYLSGGERTAVALAYRLALNQVINSLLSKIKTKDLMILDEPTDGFSEQQLDKMRDVLSQLNVAQLILVSHESKIESFVENIIKFKKENHISYVEE